MALVCSLSANTQCYRYGIIVHGGIYNCENVLTFTAYVVSSIQGASFFMMGHHARGSAYTVVIHRWGGLHFKRGVHRIVSEVFGRLRPDIELANCCCIFPRGLFFLSFFPHYRNKQKWHEIDAIFLARPCGYCIAPGGSSGKAVCDTPSCPYWNPR